MKKILTVATREFLDTVRTKMFIISSVLLPVLMLGMIFGAEKLEEIMDTEEIPDRKIAVRDETGRLFAPLQAVFDAHNQESPQRKFVLVDASDRETEELAADVLEGRLYAYLVFPTHVITGDPETGEATYELGRKDNQLAAFRSIRELVRTAIVGVRFREADPPVDVERIERLQTRPEVREVDVRSGTETTDNTMARIMTPFAFMFLLFMGTMNISQGLLTSLIEEKSSRVVEVLLSAVSPTQLMAGKILGMVSVGILLLVVWAGLGWYGVHSRGMGYLVTSYRITHMVLYFIPAFLFFASFLAAIGSACNTLKEAQSLAMPVTLLTIVPMMLWFQITESPGSTFAVVLSYIPPLTPFVMMLRICADPDTPLLQIVTTLLLLWASVGVTIWAAGRIFRVGLLMYGKAPSFGELIHWLRYN